LDVATHELLGVLLEHLVDLVQEVVELGLELLTLLVGGGNLFDRLLVAAGRSLLLDLLSFCNGICFLLRAQTLQQFGGAGHATQQFFDM